MKRVHPYKTVTEAKAALDNGGRFYNFFTKADDRVISPSELGKVAGLFNNAQKKILFLDMAISELNIDEKNQILSMLSKDLQSTYDRCNSVELPPSRVDAEGKISTNIITEGVPKKIASKSDFNGFIMVPIVAGKVTTFTMIPIIETYDVYEIAEEGSTESIIIAHAKGVHKLPKKKIKVGGILKELKSKKEESEASGKYLEVVYYVDY